MLFGPPLVALALSELVSHTGTSASDLRARLRLRRRRGDQGTVTDEDTVPDEDTVSTEDTVPAEGGVDAPVVT